MRSNLQDENIMRLWDEFKQTGHIESYLSYRDQLKRNRKIDNSID